VDIVDGLIVGLLFGWVVVFLAESSVIYMSAGGSPFFIP
jgi:uncharacterized membrane protein YedE/YeeE